MYLNREIQYWKERGAKLCAAMLLTFFTACSPEEPAPQKTALKEPYPPPLRQTLRWMGHWKDEGAREKLVHEVREEFSFRHPEIDLQFKFAKDILPEKSQYAAAAYIAEMIRSGNLEWDVIWLDPLIYTEVAIELDDWNWGHKHLVNFLTVPEVMANHQPILVGSSDAHKYTAGLFPGPYIEGFFYAAWYNKQTADKLGIRIREEGMTTEDLLNYVKKVHAHNQTAEKPITAFLDFGGSGATLRLFYNLLLSCQFTDHYQPDQAATLARIRALFKELGRYEPLKPGLVTGKWPEAARSLLEGKALLYFDATWRYNAFEQVDSKGLEHLRLAQLPEFGGHGHSIGGYISTWAVLKNAPGSEAGVELMKYWSRPEIAERWVRYTKSPTGLKGNLYDPRYGLDTHAYFQRRISSMSRHRVAAPIMFSSRFIDNGIHLDPDVAKSTVALLAGQDASEPADDE
ncbi:ABC transporter substrate-binding protein [Pontiellaceae bacterium B12227]|nr:ABC transporter substrate-binding protein [Pontiellaceae bacterium B12227]